MRAEDPLHQLFCRNVSAARKALGWTQAEAAQRLGVTQPRYAEIEGGRGEPVLSQLGRVAKLFGEKPHRLIDPDFVPRVKTKRELVA